MSVFPVKLPLFPILNASESVQRLIDKDAEDARAIPSKDEADEQPKQMVAVAQTEEASRLAAVGGVMAASEATDTRPGGEIIAGGEGAFREDATEEMPRLDMRS